MMKIANGSLLAVVAITACGTGVDSAPDNGDNGDGGAGDDESLHGSSAACPEPDGPRHDYATVGEATSLIVGKWVQCSGPTPPTLTGSKGIEIAPDGKYFVLISDGQGGLVRDTGFTAQGTWDLKENPGSIFLELWPTPSSVILDSPLFEDGPRRFAFDPSHKGALSVYQAIDP